MPIELGETPVDASGSVGLSAAVDSALGAAPDLMQNPSAAVAVAQAGGDVGGNAQAVAHATNIAAAQAGADKVTAKAGGKNWWDHLTNTIHNDVLEPFRRDVIGDVVNPVMRDVVKPVMKAPIIGDALAAMGKPLQQVQHEYRFIHDVVARHGVAGAIPDMLALGAGAAAGYELGGYQGAKLGAEAGVFADSRLEHQDSWDRTGKADYTDNGEQVSVGRDIADVLPLKKDSSPYTVVSGALDFIADAAFDPLAIAGKMKGGIMSPEGGDGLIGRHFGGNSAFNVDQAFATRPGLVRWAEDAMGKSPAEIMRTDPRLEGVANAISKAKSVDEVKDVFRAAATTKDLMSTALPSRGWFGIRGALNDVAENVADKVTDTVGRKLQLTPVQLVTQDGNEGWTRAIIDHSAPGAAQSFKRMLDFGLKDSVAKPLIDQYLESADDLGARKLIFKNGVLATALAMGMPEESSFVRGIRAELSGLLDGKDAGISEFYGSDMEGNNVSKVVDAENDVTRSAALWNGQTSSRSAMPDFLKMKKAIAASRAMTEGSLFDSIRSHPLAAAKYGALGADDFLYHNWTATVFKPLALMSAGFGFRIAAAEALPAAFRLGPVDMVKARIASTIGRWEYGLEEEELGHLKSAVAHVFGRMPARLVGPDGYFPSSLVDDTIDMIHRNGGAGVSPAVNAAHVIDETDSAPTMAHSENIYKAAVTNPKVRQTGMFRGWGPDDAPDGYTHSDIWQGQLEHIANDGGGRAGAKAYLEAIDAGATPAAAAIKFAEADKAHFLAQPKSYQSRFIRQKLASADGLNPIDDMMAQRARAFQGLTHSPLRGDANTAGGTIWRNGETDIPVKVTGPAGIGPDGRQYMNIEGSASGVPADELRTVQGGLTGGVPNRDLIEAAAAGRTVPKDVLDAIPTVDRPLMTPGGTVTPVLHSKFEDAVSAGYRRVVDPVVNYFSREPIYALEYHNQMELMRKAGAIIGEGADPATGILTHDEAAKLAQFRAVIHMTPFIHNTQERDQFAELAHNAMPFYFAQVQAYKRFGRLFAEDPGAWRQFQLLESNLMSVGHQAKDSKGANFIGLPGSGFLNSKVVGTLAALGVPTTTSGSVAFTGNAKSLNTIFPFSDDFNPLHKLGPAVLLPLQALEAAFPAARPAITSVAGSTGANESPWQTLIPNHSLYSLISAFPPFDHQRAYVSSVNQMIQEDHHHDEQVIAKWLADGHQLTDVNAPSYDNGRLVVPPEAIPGEQNVKMDTYRSRVQHRATINYLMKAVIGAVSPLAPSFDIGDLPLKAELRDAINKDGISVGTQKFMDAHPDATALTIGLTQDKSGSNVPATQAFFDWYTAHKGLISKYGNAALWMAPRDPGKWDPNVFAEELAAGARAQKAPQNVIDDVYIAEGNRQYYEAELPAFERMKAQIMGVEPQYNEALAKSKAGDPMALQMFNEQTKSARHGHAKELAALDQQWQTGLKTFGLQHPTWYKNFLDHSTSTVERDEVVANIRGMIAANEVPSNPQAQNIVGIMGNLDSYLNAINPTNYPAGRVPTKIRDAVTLNWQSYLEQELTDNPGLSPIINRVFRNFKG